MQRLLTYSFAAVAAVGLMLLAGTTAVRAHHGWTGYDESKPVTLTGTIREAAYENPHGSVKLQESGAAGKTWNVILAPPSRMTSRGLAQDMLKVGTQATAVGYVHRSVTDELRAERVTIAGKTTELR